MSLPKVSCLCPTFARTHLLEEAIESFLRQDYQGDSELIICNDFAPQHLIFEHPRVRIMNLEVRCPNLGNKRNTTASLATGDLLITWGDDDIHLPSRITRMVQHQMKSGARFCLEGPHFLLDGTGLHRKEHSTCGAHIIERSLYEELEGIPHMNCGEDASFNERVEKKCGPLNVCSDEPMFIYRWNSGRPHISWKKEGAYQFMLDNAIDLVAKGKEPSGGITLRPHWCRDWGTLAAAVVRAITC